MARPNVTDLVYRWFADTRQFERGTKQAQRSLGGVGDMVGRVGGLIAGAFAGQQLLTWAQDAIQLAAAAEEVDSKFQSVFGTANELNDALREWGDMAGVTETQAKDLAATFGNLAQAQGFTNTESQKLAVEVAKLAGDMGSFNDVDPSTVFNDLNKALLTTEREGMKKYGVAITEAEVKTRALAIATADGRTEVTAQDRALASLEIATRQAGRAVGDLERTQDSTANRARQLTADIREQQEAIGRELIPVYHELLGLVKIVVPALEGVGFAISGVTEQINPAEQSVEKWKNGLQLLFPPLIAIEKAINGVRGEVEETDIVFQEFADTQRIIADALLKQGIPSMSGAADEANELADAMNAQAAAMGRVESIFMRGDLFAGYRELQRLGRTSRDVTKAPGLFSPGSDYDIPDYVEYTNRVNP